MDLEESAESHDPASRVAIALNYDFKGAPRVTAKGRGFVAAEILKSARDHEVPIEENAALAGALSNVALDDEIPEALYRAVAEILGFVLRVKARSQGNT
jgi:flagellar biosynthesis protein